MASAAKPSPATPADATDTAPDGGSDGSGPDESLPADPAPSEFPDISALSYEVARDELTSIVAQLEGGQVPLEQGMQLWRRGEALATHCTAWLDGAQREITAGSATD